MSSDDELPPPVTSCGPWASPVHENTPTKRATPKVPTPAARKPVVDGPSASDRDADKPSTPKAAAKKRRWSPSPKVQVTGPSSDGEYKAGFRNWRKNFAPGVYGDKAKAAAELWLEQMGSGLTQKEATNVVHEEMGITHKRKSVVRPPGTRKSRAKTPPQPEGVE